MNILLEELTGGLPGWGEFSRVLIRLVTSMRVGAVIGYQREHAGKAAGLRTHILVAMGSALFVLAGAAAEMSMEGLSCVIHLTAAAGVAAGLGGIGLALLCGVLTWIVLALLGVVSAHIAPPEAKEKR